MNILNAIGRLGGDAEVRYTQSGTAVTVFSVAVDSGFGKNKTTMWIRCNMWGDRGKAVAPYILKGQQIGISGEISLSTWTGKDGVEKTSLECRVNDVTLIGSREDPQPTPQAMAGRATAEPQQDFPDDDIPF